MSTNGNNESAGLPETANQDIALSGVEGLHLSDSLRQSIKRAKPRFIGIASAFVSNQGVQEFLEIFRASGKPKCRLIAGIDNAITHPEALYAARESGWDVRLGSASSGIFHPKLIVAGDKLSRDGLIEELSCIYVGSSNLTGGGLKRNVECGFIAHAEGCPKAGSAVFSTLWKSARLATEKELKNYSALFSESARRRSVSELDNLGINDSLVAPLKITKLNELSLPVRPAIKTDFALAAWTGLQSFTGEYQFQVEFPRAAGIVTAHLVKAKSQSGGKTDVYCPDEKSTRAMKYKYYSDNGMFRLNVPNDVPGVAWARENKDGIAIIERGLQGGAPLQFRILKPSIDLQEIVGRSVALGTWGRTTTRAYGWF